MTKYYEQGIEAATGGFGMYQASANSGDDHYEDMSDLISAAELREYVCTYDKGWAEDEDTELVDAIKEVAGNCYNEPAYLLAYRDMDGYVTVTGIDTISE